ncbi:ATP-binding protein [Streptomyces sp. NPDC054855]
MTVMAEAGAKQYRQEMTVDPNKLGIVRRIVTAHVRCWGWAPMADAAVMCVTELLSNVSKHVDSNECVLLLQSSASGVRIVVSDDSPELPVVRTPDWDSESGRGVFLLSETADAWGVDPTGNGKDVWVEFRRGGAA